jgi:hypothetical protein
MTLFKVKGVWGYTKKLIYGHNVKEEGKDIEIDA